MRQQVVGKQQRLRVLQVRAPRHDRGRVRLRLRHERVEQLHHLVLNTCSVVDQIQPHKRRDLVIAAPTRAKLAAELRADRVHEFSFEREVHVFVFGAGADTALPDSPIDRIETRQHPRQLVVIEIPGRSECPGVGTRPLKVVGRKLPIEVGRTAELLQFGGRSAREAATPEARAASAGGGVVVVGARCVGGRCHGFRSPRVVISLEVTVGR